MEKSDEMMKKEQKSQKIPQEIVDAMQQKKVLIVGDIMLDRFVYGEATRISPESPVPVLAISREDSMLGGAGNVLANLFGLGVKASVLALVSEDEAGQAVRALICDQGGNPDGLIVTNDRPTTIKTRYLASHQQLLRTDFESRAPVSGALEAEIMRKANSLLSGVDAVILSDYGKGLLTGKIVKAVIKGAGKKKIPVLVDPKGTDYSLYKGADVVTPNRKELFEATGLPTGTDEEVTEAARHLMRQSGIDAVVATRSQDGMTIVRGRADVAVHLQTSALEVFDVSGAGDTVIATLAAGLAAGADLVDAASLANCAGGVVVAKVGTAPIRRAELLAEIGNRDVSDINVCRADEAGEQVRRWKARGLKVGFTNGCFDILHYGHVSYLTGAREKCDRLVVGLNEDESVKRLKGADRPLHDEVARAAVLSALSSVDMVVLFGGDAAADDKPVRLIEGLQPDIYFKGGDYTIDQLPEAPVVQSYGGEVSIMPQYEGHSTTATIAKMKGKMKGRAA